MQAAYHAEVLGSGASLLGHAHLVPRPAPPHMFLPTGYGGVTPGQYPPMGTDAAAAAVVQPQAYALPGYNYASPFTSALTTPLLNVVQSSLVTASSNAASEMQQLLASPGQPGGIWAQENTSSCSENGFNQMGATPGAQQPYAGMTGAALLPPQQDAGVAQLGTSAAGFLTPGGYGTAVDVWKHLALVAASGGVQSAAPLQVQASYGAEYQLPYVQQQQQHHATTAALQMQAAYLQQQQQQQTQQPPYGAAGPTVVSLGAAAAAASLAASQAPAGNGLPPSLASAPAHVLQLIQQHQQKLQQQQQQQTVQSVVTPDSLSDPALAAAAATALHLLQLPAGLRALAACGIMPHLLQPQQAQQPQTLPLPVCGPASAACYGPGLLAALLPPLAPNGYAPCEPLTAAARTGMSQLQYQPQATAPGMLAAQLQPRAAFGVPTEPSSVYPREAGPEVSDPRLQHFQLHLQQAQQQQQHSLLQQQQQSSQPLPGQAQPMEMTSSQGFPEQQQEPSKGQQVVRPQGEVRRTKPSSPTATATIARRESLAGSLSAHSPADNEPYTETSSPSPTREPSSAPSGQVMGAAQPTSAALLILGLQEQQQLQRQQQLCPFPRCPDSPPKSSSERQLHSSPRKGLLSAQLGLPQGPPLLHFAGVPLQLPMPHAVLQAAARQPAQPTSSCPPPPVKSHASGAAAAPACTSTSAPAGAVETRRRTLADRRERRKESNRESARRCRLRREKDTCDLSRRVTAQEADNGKILSQLQRLEQVTNMLQDQNNVLEAWLKHIQGAGEGAAAAASTILGYVQNLDEQMAAAIAAVQLQAEASHGGYLPSEPVAMLQVQSQPKVHPEMPSRYDQGLQQQLGWPSEGAFFGEERREVEATDAGMGRGFVLGPGGARLLSRGGDAVGSDNAAGYHQATEMDDGTPRDDLRRSDMICVEEEVEEDQDEGESEDEDNEEESESAGEDMGACLGGEQD